MRTYVFRYINEHIHRGIIACYKVKKLLQAILAKAKELLIILRWEIL